MPKDNSPAKKLAREIQRDTGKPYTACLRQAQEMLQAKEDAEKAAAAAYWADQDEHPLICRCGGTLTETPDHQYGTVWRCAAGHMYGEEN